MSKFSELEQKGLIEAFDLEEHEVFEARQNLLGFFEVLYRIDKRIKSETKTKNNKEKQRKEQWI